METKSGKSAVDLIGYGVGMGLVAVALIGIPLQFAYPDFSAVVSYGGAFILGGLIGVGYASVRGTGL